MIFWVSKHPNASIFHENIITTKKYSKNPFEPKKSCTKEHLSNPDKDSFGRGYASRYIWLRLVYNQTEDTWEDPDKKEILTILDNFNRDDGIETCAAVYAVMDYKDQWWSKCPNDSNNYISSDVVCELT